VKIVTIKEATAPLRAQIRNAYIDFSKMTCSVVAVVTDVQRDGGPVVGYGFNSNGRYSQGSLLRERFIPRIMSADPASLVDDERGNLNPERIWDIAMTDEKPGGHGERSVALGALDMAIWDATAKIDGLPLYRLLAERYGDGQVQEDVFVYGAGGYYQPGATLQSLQDELGAFLDKGFTLVKMKIGGAKLPEDLRRIEAALEVLERPDQLAVDANGRFGLDEALAYARGLEPYGLRWFEEPGDPLDFELLAQVADVYSNPLATGENAFSSQDARNLLRYSRLRKDLDILQFDCALSYGVPEFARILRAMDEMDWKPESVIPHGGHLLSIHLAAGLGLGGAEVYPWIFQPYASLPDDIEIVDGRVRPPSQPGIGYESCSELYEQLQQLVGD
jgi:D(-)-tartrate dehydratase